MPTKAQRLRRKRGRPRTEGVAREPNGRISRSGIPHEPADIVAIEARMRMHGLTPEAAKDQKAATFIGRLSLAGNPDGINTTQYDALVSYRDLNAAHLRAIKAPNAALNNDAVSVFSDPDSPEYVEWVARTRTRWDACRKAVQEEQNYSRENLWGALQLCVIDDQEHYHLIGSLRIAANVLARFFRA